MAKSRFLEKETPPTAALLEEALGDGLSLWKQALDCCVAKARRPEQTWKYYGRGWGWTLAFSDGNEPFVPDAYGRKDFCNLHLW